MAGVGCARFYRSGWGWRDHSASEGTCPKPHGLSPIPKTYMVEGANWLLQVFSDLHVCVMDL